MRCALGQERAHCLQQLAWTERLRQEGVRTLAARGCAFPAVSGQNEPGEVRVLLPEPDEDILSRDAWHLPAEENELGALRRDEVEGDVAVACFGKLELRARERRAQQLPDERVVVDEQDARRPGPV